jgi:precorrin-2 dehydrogenase/sirohydrochlorin ferrochelatase
LESFFLGNIPSAGKLEGFAMGFPVVLNIDGRLCCVVGAGKVAERKVQSVLKAGARVRVVGLDPTPQLMKLAHDKQIECYQRRFVDADLTGCWMVFAATDDDEVNAHVGALANEQGILFGHAAGGSSDFMLPAVLDIGDLQIAVSTNGASPLYARWVRDYLQQHLVDEHAEVLSVLKWAREKLKSDLPNDSVKRQKIWRTLISKEMVEAVQVGNVNQVKQRISECLSLSQG